MSGPRYVFDSLIIPPLTDRPGETETTEKNPRNLRAVRVSVVNLPGERVRYGPIRPPAETTGTAGPGRVRDTARAHRKPVVPAPGPAGMCVRTGRGKAVA